MELTTFLRTFRRRWFVSLGFFVLAIGGVAIYHRLTLLETARATVAVLDPVAARPGARAEAQVPFDQVIKSHRLATQVGQRLGEAPDLVAGRLSASVAPPSSAAGAISPLYAVQGKDRDPGRAKRLATVAVEEGRRLYLELNFANSAEIRQSLDAEAKQAAERLQQARQELNGFATTNDAVGLPQRLIKQVEVVTNLQSQLRQLDTFAGRQALSRERQELDRLAALQAQYNTFDFKVREAEARVSEVGQQEQALVIAQQLPATTQIKLLDGARIQSPMAWLLLTYAVGVLVGLLLGASAIYVLAMVARQPETPEQVAVTFGAPILARIPKAKGTHE